MVPASPRIPALTGLRFLLAMQLLGFHLHRHVDAIAPSLGAALGRGYVGVTALYFLSGFVLALSRPREMQPAERRRFWEGRFARLYPGYLLGFLGCVPFVVVAAIRTGEPSRARAAASALAYLLGVQSWFPPLVDVWNWPGWSTSVVAFFSLVFPFVAGRLSRSTTLRVLLVALASWGMALVGPWLYLRWLPDGGTPLGVESHGSWMFVLKYSPIARVWEFVAGIAVGLAYGRHGGRELGRAAAGALVALAAAGIAVACAADLPYPLLHNGLLLPAVAALVVGTASARGAVERVLAAPLVVRLGEASFTIYILQLPLQYVWNSVGRRAGVEPFGAAGLPLFFAFVVGVSVLAYERIERPAIAALRARLAPATSAAPATA